MLVFFIHGVGTRDSNYHTTLVKKIKCYLNSPGKVLFYGSFWGNEFNNKKTQIINSIQSDIQEAISNHKIDGWLKKDVYRYQDRRFQFINDFLGDFLNYQNLERGKRVRKIVIQQFFQFMQDHPQEEEIHFVAHSLGCLILWDLLFSPTIKDEPDIVEFRECIFNLKFKSITTLGSPLLFIKHFMDLDYSSLNEYLDSRDETISVKEYALRWVNIIHSSDLIAYPMQSSVKDQVSDSIFFVDQFVWLNANSSEPVLRGVGQQDGAMVVAAFQAHSSYFADNLDGSITGKIIAQNLQGRVSDLSRKRIHSWDKKL